MPKIIYGPFYSQVEDIQAETLKALRENLSYDLPVKDMFFSSNPAGRYKQESVSYLINQKGKFYSGLINDAYKIITQLEGSCDIEMSFQYPEINIEDGIFRISKMPFKMRPYQETAFEKGVQQGRGIFKMATGAGKSVLISAFAAFYFLPTLIVVDSVDLCKQLANEITEYTGFPCGIIQGPPGTWDIKTINVGMIDSLNNFLKNKKNLKTPQAKFLKSLEVLMIDECHHATAPSYAKLISFIEAPIRFGFTATPIGAFYKNKEGQMVTDSIKIKAMIGPMIENRGTKQLIDEGWLSVPNIFMIQNDIEFDGNILSFEEEVERCILMNKQRNEIGAELISSKYKEGKNVIVFVTRIEHGKILTRLLQEKGVPADTIRYATGQVVGSSRKEMFNDYKDGSAKILIGTVLNEGLNFQCQVGVNMAGGYTPKAAIQRLGRVLRKPRGPSGDVDTDFHNEVEYYDFLDSAKRNPDGSKRRGKNPHPFFVKHGHMRIETYIEEGHNISIVNPEEILERKGETNERATEKENETGDFGDW